MIQTKKADWSKRIERAIDLAVQHPSAAEVLAFYCRILDFQKTLNDKFLLQPAPALNREVAFREQLDVAAALQQVPALLALVQRSGPAKLAQQAAEIGRGAAERQRSMLHDFLAADLDDSGPDSFFARVLFQPQAEYFAA